jgi:hypothetical protein
MVEWRGNQIFVKYHEWAFSLRTSGFPVYAILPSGAPIRIGVTQKAPTSYKLPPDAAAVIREYRSNRGYRTFYVYLPDGREFKADEKSNFELPAAPEAVRKAVEILAAA